MARSEPAVPTSSGTAATCHIRKYLSSIYLEYQISTLQKDSLVQCFFKASSDQSDSRKKKKVNDPHMERESSAVSFKKIKY